MATAEIVDTKETKSEERGERGEMATEGTVRRYSSAVRTLHHFTAGKLSVDVEWNGMESHLPIRRFPISRKKKKKKTKRERHPFGAAVPSPRPRDAT